MTEIKNTILFLDVDGVLNCHSTKERSPVGFTGIEDEKVGILKEIIDKTNADIVLSSTWKDDWKDGKKDGKYLDEKLARQGLIVKDCIDDVYSWAHRGLAIRKYMDAHPEYTHMVIFDDELFDFKERGLMRHLVQTTDFNSGNGAGLLPKHVRLAVAAAQRTIKKERK